jgi:DNA repair exonuclease SbcCD ATPase subunit
MSEIDILDELLAEDKVPEEPTADDIKALESKVAALEKKNNGLLADVKSERKKRQQVSGQHEKLTQTVSSILEQRNQTLNSITNAVQPELKPKEVELPVEYDEDGKGTVKGVDKTIQSLTAPYEQRIAQLENAITQLNQVQSAEAEANQVIQSLVGQKPEFAPAHSKYQTARKWADDKVVEFQKEHGIQGLVEPGQALDHIFDDDLENEFNEKFPGVDLETVVMAETSTRAFNKMLNALSTPADPVKKQLDDDSSKFKKVMNKPSGLGQATNEGEGTIMDKVATLGADDIMNLSDKQAQALQDAMLAEEKRDGIKF